MCVWVSEVIITAYLMNMRHQTAPYLIQFSQNLTSDCLLISVYLPVFALCAHKIVLQIKTKQLYELIMQKPVQTGKSPNNSISNFGLIEENIELSHIHLAVHTESFK